MKTTHDHGTTGTATHTTRRAKAGGRALLRAATLLAGALACSPRADAGEGWLEALAARVAGAAVAQAAAPAQELTGHEIELVGFDGDVPPLPSRDEALRRLADAELLLTIDRDARGARAVLDPLRVALFAAEPFEGQADLLARDLVLRVQAALADGRADEAGLLVTRVRIPVKLSGDEARDAATRARLDVLADALLDDPRVAALRVRLAGTASARPVAPELRETVEEALRRGDRRVLQDLGSRAVPVLVDVLHPEWGSAGAVAGFGLDPAMILVELDQVTALREFTRLLHAGFARPQRVLDAFARSGMTRRDSDAWIDTPGRMPRFLASDWLDLLARCLELPGLDWKDSAKAVGEILKGLAEFDAVPERLARAAGRMSLGLDGGAAYFVEVTPGQIGRRTSLVPLYEEALEHPLDAIRVWCATRLADHPGSRALRRHVDDPDPRVRAQLAFSLRPHPVTDVRYRGRNVTLEQIATSATPVIDADARELLRALARDPDAGVRGEAVRSILALGAPLEREVYLALARDASADVRLTLAGLARGDALPDVLDVLAADANPVVRLALAGRAFADLDPDPAARDAAARTLRTLARDADPSVRQRAVENLVRSGTPVDDALASQLAADPDPVIRRTVAQSATPAALPLFDVLVTLSEDADPSVREAVDERLRDLVEHDDWTKLPSAGFFALLERRVFAARDPSSWARTVRTIVRAGGHLARIASWLRAHPDADWLWSLVENEIGSQQVAETIDLPADELVELVAGMVLRNGAWRGLPASVLNTVRETTQRGERVSLDVWRTLLGRLDLDRGFGLAVIQAVGPAWTSADVSRLVAFLARPAWNELPIDQDEDQLFGWMRLEPEIANATISAVLEREDVEPAVQLAVARSYAPSGPGGVELTREILARWFGPTAQSAVARAVDALGEHPEAADPALLDLALDGAYAGPALGAMRTLRDPRYLPALARYASEHRSDKAVATIEAYLDDAAVDVLLELAGTAGDRDFRERCMQGVRSIQDYLLARQAWQRRMAEGRTRDDAVAELLAMIDGDDALLRAESVRALGALGAVEHMPKVIALLRDADPAVAAAAREALDALHAAAEPQDG